MSFSIIDQTATLNHINVRSEKHGGENVGGADLRISFTESAGILAEFHPSMRCHFYVADEEQGQLEGVEALTKRRFGDLVERVRVAVASPAAQEDALASLVHHMFASGNSIPVDRITITRQQYDAARSAPKGE